MSETPAPDRGPRWTAERAATLAACVFAVVGLAWVAVTDLVFSDMVGDGWAEIWPRSLVRAGFVLAVSMIVFALVRHYGGRWARADESVRISEEALRRSESRFRALVERVPGVVWLNEVDADDPSSTHCVYVAPQLEELLGCTPQEWMADDDLWERVIHPDDRARVRGLNERADDTGALSMEYRAIHRDGSIVWIHDEAVLFSAEGDRPAYWQGVMVDITAQRIQDEALHELIGSLRAVFDASPLAILVLEPDGRVRHWNPAAERMFGWTAREIVGRALPHVPQDKTDEFEELQRRTSEGAAIAGFDTVRVRKDGSRIDVSVSTAALVDGDGRVSGYLGVIEDATERKRATDEQARLRAALADRAGELERLAEERRQMLKRIVRAHEEERQRIALELHDGLGQLLTSISLFASDLEVEVGAAARARAVRVNELIRRAIVDSRHLVWSLRPPELERLGLVPALRRLADEVTAPELTVDLHEEIGDARLEPEIEAVVYRVVQEAVHNAQKHARASAISILLQRHDGDLMTLVEDNGRGFDPSSVPPGRGLGLLGMRERAQLADGALVVESATDAGTRVRLLVPIEVSEVSEAAEAVRA